MRFQFGGISRLCRTESMACKSSRNAVSVFMSCLAISGHCAPWPLKTKTRGSELEEILDVAETSIDFPC